MKAWEREYNLRIKETPDENYKPTWEGVDEFERFYDFLLKLFWQSRVPGSGAWDSMMVGAVQSVENMGRDVEEAEILLEEGFYALERSDMPKLREITSYIYYLLNNAPIIEGHPYHSFRRPLTWDEISKDFPRDPYPKLSDDLIREKVYGGWIGQISGASMGTFLEGYLSEQLIKVFGKRLGTYLTTPDTTNDDITYEIAFLLTYREKGDKITSEDIARKWIAHIPFGWSAEYIALENLRKGIYPPQSGQLSNPYREWIGAQMREMVAGLLAPANPKKAAWFAFLDARISHEGNGVYGGIHSALLTSLAFLYKDPRELVLKVNEYIPRETEFAYIVKHAIDWCREEGDWKGVYKRTREHLKKYHWIHLYPNTVAVICALWFGEGDFDKTMNIIASFGYDVDCNAGEVGTILGVQLGINNIDKKWYAPFNGMITTYMTGYKELKIENLVNMTVENL